MNIRTTTNGLFPIDASTFAEHVQHCDRCRRYDAEHPDTLALLCLDGSVLLKNGAPKVVKPKPVLPTDKNKTSKKEAQRLMRYKEES